MLFCPIHKKIELLKTDDIPQIVNGSTYYVSVFFCKKFGKYIMH